MPSIQTPNPRPQTLATRRLYCLGDSHAGLFSGRDVPQPQWPTPARDWLPGFRTFRIGIALAHNLCETGHTSRGRENLLAALDSGAIPEGAALLLCLGEIDCRAHLLRQARLQNRPAEEVACTAAERYFSVVRELQARGYRVLVWNAIPSSPLDRIDDKEFPAEGDCQQRNIVTRVFNSRLAELCQAHGAAFISIFDQLVDATGRSRRRYYRPDLIHLSQRALPLALAEVKRHLPDLDITRPLTYRLYASAPALWARHVWWHFSRRAGRLYRRTRYRLFGPWGAHRSLPAPPLPNPQPGAPTAARHAQTLHL